MTFAVLVLVASLATPVLVNAVVHFDRRRILRGACEGDDALPWSMTVRAFIVECAALALSFGMRVFGTVRRPALVRDGGQLVILVPGDGLNARSFWLLERRLRLLGWDTAVLNAGACRVPLDRASDEIGERILRVCEASHTCVVSVLAFGCSGLLVRRWLRNQPAAPVQQFITLGTPHQGTRGLLSRFEGLHFLRPSSSFLRDLAEQDPVPSRFDPIAISCELDAWYFPSDTSYYPGAFNIAVRDIGHFTLLFSKRIAQLVDENLRTAGAIHRK